LSPATQSATKLEQIVSLLAKSIALRNEQQLPEALAVIDEILERVPDFAPCYLNRVLILAELGRYEDSLIECSKLLAVSGPLPENLALRDEIRDQALAAFEQALQETPDDSDVLFRRGNIYMIMQQYTAAEEAYAALLKDNPDHQGAIDHRGHALLSLNRREEALQAYRQLLLLPFGEARHWVNFGNVLQNLNCLEEAGEAYRQATLRDPELAEAYLELGHCRLAAGDFEAGWQLYEWRWKTMQLAPQYLPTTQPLWLGEEGLENKTILLWAEQGLGDVIQFARFVPRVADLGGKVILRVPRVLRTLLQSLDTRITLIDEQEALPAYDCHCPLMSLPLALGIAGPPDAVPYLQADAARIQHWSDTLGPRQRLRIGLVWAGKQGERINVTRDMPLSVLLPLAELDVDIVCLQKEIPAADIDVFKQFPRRYRSETSLSDFSETAALMENLDIVISVDTAVAHLAGALSKPCWLLLRQSSEWRWQLERADSPWYPSMRIFRQHQQGNWPEVVDLVCQEIQQLVSA